MNGGVVSTGDVWRKPMGRGGSKEVIAKDILPLRFQSPLSSDDGSFRGSPSVVSIPAPIPPSHSSGSPVNIDIRKTAKHTCPLQLPPDSCTLVQCQAIFSPG